MIEVRELIKVFDARGQQVRAVDNVTTHVAKGEVLVVIGPSGSGKSTFSTPGSRAMAMPTRMAFLR